MTVSNMTLPQFILHLANAQAGLVTATHAALERAALVVEQEAKGEPGTYQGEAPPFVAWAELADATKDDRVRQGYPENEPLLREGDMRDSIGHVVQGNEAAVGSNDPIAEYQELGTAHIPPRSFLGGAAVRKAPEVAQILGQAAVMHLTGGGVAGGALPI